MAYATIDDPSAYFKVQLYTGDGGTTQAITFNDTDTNMQPDWVWIKMRSEAQAHILVDSVRGANKYLGANHAGAEADDINSVTAFGSDGFTVGNDDSVNKNTGTYVSWSWKAGTTSGLSGGNITPSSYSFNVSAGFGIYKYTGNGSSDQTIPHGLGKKPQMVFFKRLDSGTNWVTQSNTSGNRVQMVLNDTSAYNTDSRLGASDSWDTTNFNVGTYGDMNSSGDPHVAYVFCNIKGYSKVGEYLGNNNANGPFVHTGFRPAWFIIKRTGSTDGWLMGDNKRIGYNDGNYWVEANVNDNEDGGTADRIDILSNGFKINNAWSKINAADTYLYMAFADAPLVNSNGIPVNAR